MKTSFLYMFHHWKTLFWMKTFKTVSILCKAKMYFSFDLKFPQLEFLHRVGSTLSRLVKVCALVDDVWLGEGCSYKDALPLVFPTFVSVSASFIRNTKRWRTLFLVKLEITYHFVLKPWVCNCDVYSMEYEVKSPLLRLYFDTVKTYKAVVEIHHSHRGTVYLDYLWSWNLNVRFCCSIPSSHTITFPNRKKIRCHHHRLFVKPFSHCHVSICACYFFSVPPFSDIFCYLKMVD